MVTKLRLVFSITIVFFSFYASGQSNYWEKVSASNKVRNTALKQFKVKDAQFFSLNESAFKKELTASGHSKKQGEIIYFPNAEGNSVPYRIHEASVLSPELSKKYPQIKSYRGYAIQHPEEKIRLSISHKEVQAMLVSHSGKPNQFVQKSKDDTYLMYSRATRSDDDIEFVCETKEQVLMAGAARFAKPVDDQVLRKYRVAISASGEYTQFHGGTKADALAAINATLTRVNEVFETDLAVTLELVADTDKVIYTNPSTDPYSGGLSTLGNSAQQTFDQQIGVNNYDFGHLFHRGVNGGNAGFIGGVCVNGQKGGAYSSGENPVGDVFDLDFVAHEIGHQLGAFHTWSYESEGTLSQMEPGSGTTIMGYAGITQRDNVAGRGDDYFHYRSIEEISETLRDKSCGETFVLANQPPIIDPLEDYTIPKSTPFVLNGTATDPDVDDVLTYTWEQIDHGIVNSANFGPTNPSGANFRSRPPSLEGVRYFPLQSRVLSGNLTQTNPQEGDAWETVSDVEREMNFALTVRDNAVGGGQVVSELVKILVTNSGGPFAVTSQQSSVTLTAGDVETIEWDVANTNVAPVYTEFVDILLSNDGGLSYTTVLASNVENDGSHDVVVPAVPTTEARIMVKPVDNIYYAVNSTDFTIEVSEVVLNFSQLEFDVCQLSDITVPFIYETYLGFSEEVTFTVEDMPVNLAATVVPDTVITGGTNVDILFENTENVPEGSYPIRIVANSATVTREVIIILNVYDTNFDMVATTAPENGLMDASINTLLEWELNPSNVSYEVQIATDAGFSNIVEVETVKTNSYMPLDLQNQTTYYWRVRPENICGQGAFNAPQTFTTVQVSCEQKFANGFPKEISANGTSEVISKISFFEDLPVSDINVNLNIEHSYVEDLVIRLTSPEGTTVTLVSGSCGEFDNINATFDDEGSTFFCNPSGENVIGGTVKPLGTLSSFDGESILGEWVLEVIDNASSDGGAVVDFSLDVCVEGEFRPDADNDGVFDDGEDQCLGTPEGVEVNTSGCQVYRFPTDNFSVSVESETCRNNDDGSITIEPLLKLDYSVTITGNGLDLTEEFTADYLLEGLSSGTYNLCITGVSGEITYEPYCFEVVISQPEALGVSSSVINDGNQLSLLMNGANDYVVELNGQTFQTNEEQVVLNLKAGKNSLKVSTLNTCQGVFEEDIFVNGPTMVSPNPFKNLTKVLLGAPEERVQVAIYTLGGQLVEKRIHQPVSREVALDLTNLPNGVYVVYIQGDEVNEVLKVIKK